MKKLILLLVVTLVASAGAATVWNPAGNTVTPGSQDWGDADNWTNGIVGQTKFVLNVPGAADAQVSDAQTPNQIVQGDNNAGGVIRVLSGGNLTTGATWSAVGYNDVAHTIVDAGGSMTFGQHAWIGFGVGANGTLDVDGYVRVNAMLGLGWNGGDGYVNVNDGGVLDLHQLHGDGSTSVKQNSLLSINGTGQILLPGDYTNVIRAYCANDLIAGDGVIANVRVDLDENGDTIVTVPEPATMILLGLGGVLLRRKK